MTAGGASRRHRALYVLFLGLLVWVPIPLGSNRPWSLGLLEAGALGMLAWWLTGYARQPFTVPPALRRARWTLVALTAWCGYVALQTVPLPDAWVATLAPPVAAAYGALDWARAGGVPLTVERGATVRALLEMTALGALGILTVALVDSRQRLRMLLSVLVLAGVANAVFGMITHFTHPWSGLWYPARDTHLVTGTFVNRNHFGGLIEMTTACALGLMLTDLCAPGGASGWRERARVLIAFIMTTGGRNALYAVIMLAALVLSTSRGAVVALGAGVGLALVLAVTAGGRGRRELALVPWLIGAVAVAALWFGVDGLHDRIASEPLAGERPALWRAGIAMAAQSPLTGLGAGSFQWVFPAFKDAGISSGYYDHLHNDFIELAVEQGAVGVALGAATLGPCLFRLARAYRRRRDPLMRGALFAAVAGTGALLAHAVVDFNFHIPSNAAYWVVLLGAGLAAAELPPARRSGVPRGRPSPVRSAPPRRTSSAVAGAGD